MLAHAADLPSAVDRALAVATAFQMLSDGELPGPDLFACLLDVLGRERSPGVVEPFLMLALEVAQRWNPNDHILGSLAELAAVATRLAENPEHATPALRTLAASASSDADFERLRGPAGSDVDLAWRVATRRAALGRYDEAEVEALLERDADPDAPVRALVARTARPEGAAKDEAWAELFEKKNVPGGPMMGAMVRAFWQPLQDDLLEPYGRRYLDEIPRLAGGGMLMVFGLMFGMFPSVADDAFVDRARAMAAEPDCDPTVRAVLLVGTDTLSRMQRARTTTA
jgi:aminopeptidase N